MGLIVHKANSRRTTLPFMIDLICSLIFVLLFCFCSDTSGDDDVRRRKQQNRQKGHPGVYTQVILGICAQFSTCKRAYNMLTRELVYVTLFVNLSIRLLAFKQYSLHKFRKNARLILLYA